MNTQEYYLGRIKALEVIKAQCENEIKQLSERIKPDDDRWVATPWGFLWL